MPRLKLGYVGCGHMAQKVHIPNIMLLEDAELVALAEVKPELGKAVQAHWQIPRLYSHHSELAADADVEAVAVSGHFAVQGEIAADLLRAGKDVFVEKPMAISAAQAYQIVAAERESGRRLMVGYMKRYDPGNIAARELLDELRAREDVGAPCFARNHGFCGDWTAGLDTFHIRTGEPNPPVEDELPWPEWLPEERRNGYLGYLQQYTHNINLLRWFLGDEADVQVRSAHLSPDDGLSGVVVLDIGGCLCSIESGSVAYHGWDEHTQIYFRSGWVRCDSPPLLLRNEPAHVEVYMKEGKEAPGVRREIFPADGRQWAYKAEMQHFVRGVLSGEPFRSPATDAARDAAAIEAIYRKALGRKGVGRKGVSP